jgi:hypothetical protein
MDAVEISLKHSFIINIHALHSVVISCINDVITLWSNGHHSPFIFRASQAMYFIMFI